MNCVINDIIDSYLQKGKKIEGIRRYIKTRYKINIDVTSIQERIHLMRNKYKVRKA